MVVNLMGAVKKEEVETFVRIVFDALELNDWKMEWTETTPGICLRKAKKILLPTRIIGRYPWEAREYALHEIAHIFALNDKLHGKLFYDEYIKLLQRFITEEI